MYIYIYSWCCVCTTWMVSTSKVCIYVHIHVCVYVKLCVYMCVEVEEIWMQNMCTHSYVYIIYWGGGGGGHAPGGGPLKWLVITRIDVFVRVYMCKDVVDIYIHTFIDILQDIVHIHRCKRFIVCKKYDMRHTMKGSWHAHVECVIHSVQSWNISGKRRL